ncbi:MAG: hypothetical protein ABI867_36310 [Kofleriaceae bacterium]
MEWFAIILFTLVCWAGLLWGSIKIIDRHNPHNRFVMALVWSALNLAASVAMMQVALLGLVLAVAYLVMMVRVLMRHYDLGILQTLGVLGLMIATPYVVNPILVDFAGRSGVRGMLVVLGLPIAILVVWFFGRRAAQLRAEKEGLPEARVIQRERPVAVEPVPAPVPVPEPVRPVARPSAPIVPVVVEPKPSVAPPAEPVAAPGEGPRFLR